MTSLDWSDFYKETDPSKAWEFIYTNITKILDRMCPIRNFNIKNYRPDWMTKELIELVKDRDYFYKKAKRCGDTDSWNIAKFLRNSTNSCIRKAKRDFVLNELDKDSNNSKKFWKVIKQVVPMDKGKSKR